MSRLLMLIAVLFAFATIGGASASYADGRVGSHGIFGTVAKAGAKCMVEQTAEVAQYKPCTKKLQGVVAPCPHQPSVLPMALAQAPLRAGRMERLVPPVFEFRDGAGVEGHFRPPRV